MNFRAIIGLLITLCIWSCNQKSSKNDGSNINENNSEITTKSGLLIENNINRGISFTDSLGSNHNLRYIPITVTNDSTIPLKLDIAFSGYYNYPSPHNQESFKLIPLEKEWVADGVEITKNLLDKLPSYIEKPKLSKIIQPGEKFLFGIGSVYPNPAKTSGVLPRTLFTKNDKTTFSECDWLQEEGRTSNQQFKIGLKVIFGEKCMIIPSGFISYQ